MPFRTIPCIAVFVPALLALSCAGAPSPHPGEPAGAEILTLGAFAFERTASRELSEGVRWDAYEADRPRRQTVHIVSIAAAAIGPSGDWKALVLVGSDPDGEGPAEASLRDPLETAADADALVLVNANGFFFLGDSGPRDPEFPYREGRPVDIHGLAVESGTLRSEAMAGAANLCIGRNGRVTIGVCAGAYQAVSGYGALILGGTIVSEPGGPRHPRTAAGITADGSLLLVVADGRSFALGPGLTLEELSDIFLDLDCVDAINLDGGGSSVLVLGDASGGHRIVNKPSDTGFPRYALRPVPVAFAVVPAEPSAP
ncbi:MAG: phosphodiester glycosidase family protein [Spirochaetales bacterium]|nr:phosphodiester glycosidase family protein [Spirochaetales bacterium]